MVQHKKLGEIQAIQFELWQNCDNNCDFCYTKLNRINCTPEQQISNIQKAKEIITQEISNFNGVALIGGEFFQGQLRTPEVKEAFLDLISYINSLLESHDIDEVWLAATLTRENQADLYQTLDLFSDISKVLISTSYDTAGRFHLQNGKEIWLNNLKQLKERYPALSLHTQTIITQAFIEETLDDTTNMIPAITKYSMIDFKLPSIFIAHNELIEKEQTIESYREVFLRKAKLYPPKFCIEHRADFLKFIYKIKDIFGKEKLYALCTPEVRSRRLYILSRNFVNKDRWDTETNEELAPCGHMLDGHGYLDSDKCARCDVWNIYQLDC